MDSYISPIKLAGHWGKELFELFDCLQKGLPLYLYGKRVFDSDKLTPRPRLSEKEIFTWAEDVFFKKANHESRFFLHKTKGRIPLAQAWIKYDTPLPGEDDIFDADPEQAFKWLLAYACVSKKEIRQRSKEVFEMQAPEICEEPRMSFTLPHDPNKVENAISQLNRCRFKSNEVNDFAAEHGLPLFQSTVKRPEISSEIVGQARDAHTEIDVLYKSLRNIGPLSATEEKSQRNAVLECFNSRKWLHVVKSDLDNRSLYSFNPGHEKRDFTKGILKMIAQRNDWDAPLEILYQAAKSQNVARDKA